MFPSLVVKLIMNYLFSINLGFDSERSDKVIIPFFGIGLDTIFVGLVVGTIFSFECFGIAGVLRPRTLRFSSRFFGSG